MLGLMRSLSDRIEADIEKFDDSIKRADKAELSEEANEIVELSKMYASDCKSWLKKGEMDTAFSCISYAHGLLDAILKIKHMIE